MDFTNIKIADEGMTGETGITNENKTPRYYPGSAPEPLETDKAASYPRKVFWYYKNMLRQKKIFNQIEKFRNELGIKVFIGVFGGIIPLTFYMNQNPPMAGVIFANMDSWFTDVLTNMNTLWYRKYYSFNYALENAGAIDFLSPYILEGIRRRGIRIKEGRAHVAPCSFIDYSKCLPGNKKGFEISFASRLEPDKNPMLYLNAASAIHAEFPEVKFHLLGEGSLVYEIENYIAKNHLTETVNFRFHKNPPEIFAGTRVFVSLQSHTNYPSQSVLEAMACGNAIIACNTGDTDLFINENNGVICRLELDDLVGAMRSLIADREKTGSLGEFAVTYVKQNHTIEKYTEYYLYLIKKTAP